MADRLILGSGYIGLEVAHRWVSRGDRVVAVTRSPDKAASMREAGIVPLLWDWLVPLDEAKSRSILAISAHFQTVLVAVTHAQQSGITPADTHVVGSPDFKHRWKGPGFFYFLFVDYGDGMASLRG